MRHLALPRRICAPFPYYGGKTNLAKRIIACLDGPETLYVEPFCGSAVILFTKPPHPIEVINDINENIVSVFRCLQDKATFRELAHRLRWTPYSLSEFNKAKDILKSDSTSPIDRAWATLVRFNQCYNGVPDAAWAHNFTHKRGMAEKCANWRGRLSLLRQWHDRLTRVQIDCRDALEVINIWDSGKTVFYIDPPYVPETMRDRSRYTYSYNLQDHEKLVSLLLQIKGRAVVSGYKHPVYKPLEDAGWKVIDIPTKCFCHIPAKEDRAATTKIPRADCTETLWVKLPKQSTRSLLWQEN